MSGNSKNNKSRKKFKNNTVENLHSKQIASIDKNAHNLEKKKKQLYEYKLKNKNTKNIEQQINDLEFKGTHLDYFDKMGDLIIDYYTERNTPSKIPEKEQNILEIFNQPVTDNTKTSKYLTSYVKRLEGTDIDKYKGNNRMIKCDTCNVEKTYYAIEGSFICDECGDMTDIIIDDDFVIKDISCYHRSGRLKEWLNQFQAKENADITDDVYIAIKNELKKKRISDYSKINRDTIRDILRKLGLTKFYDNIAFIINKLNNIPAPKMTHQQEKVIFNAFDLIEDIWDEVKPSGRKNMISYSYLLHKLCELFEYDEYLPCFPLLKSPDVLRKQDKIWERICKRLNWEYYPSFK
jgi:hypothetical protein